MLSSKIPRPQTGAAGPSPKHAGSKRAVRGARLPVGAVLPKLEVGAPDSPLEDEADRIAERVLRATGSAGAPSGSDDGAVRRKCTCGGAATEGGECEACKQKREAALQRAANSASASAIAAAPPVVDEVLRASGRPLDPATRAFFEPRFGADFSRVRVHDGAVAADAARAIDARAYTRGHDIAFASGQFAPHSHAGRLLLAHELAHVVQQGSAPRTGTIHRAAHDFEIRGKFPHSAALPNFIFFDLGSSSLDAVEQAKVDALALPAGDLLTLNGFASEEGSAAPNLAVVNARLDAVAARLVAKGHDAGKIHKVPLPSSGEGRIDYRRMRSVEILKPGGASAVPPAAAATTAPCAGSNETTFTEAEGEAETMLGNAATALAAAPIPAAMTGPLNRLFSGWTAADAAKIGSNLTDIKAQIHLLLDAGRHQCGIIKYAACEAGSEAENTHSGAAAMMTLCPTFFNPAHSKKARAGTLIHEASHGTPGLTTDDKAYGHERLIEFLSLPDALANADTYALLVRLHDGGGAGVNVGPAMPDPLTGGMTPGEQTAARRSMAWMEKWLIWSYQEMSSLYDEIEKALTGGAWTNAYYKDTMSLAAPLFGLTAPPALPTKTDKVKVAAIHDRFHIMRATEWSTAVTLHKVAAGPVTWAAGPGTSVDLGPAFFADSPRGQLDRLLTAIAKATPDVSAALVPKYVTLADKIRTHMGGGGP